VPSAGVSQRVHSRGEGRARGRARGRAAGYGAVVGSRRPEPSGEPLSSSIAAWPRRACAPLIPGEHRSSCARAGSPAGDRTSPWRSTTLVALLRSLAGHPRRQRRCLRRFEPRTRGSSNTSSFRRRHRHCPRHRRPRTGRRGLHRPCRGRGTGKCQRKADHLFRGRSGDRSRRP
jgi:hypothetical protein